MLVTKLKKISIGLVAEDKKLNEDIIKIYPIEILPLFDGELEPVNHNIKSSGLDLNGDLYSVNIDVSNYIEAEWLGELSNRISPPDVVRGEQVMIWGYADSTEYYWTTLGRDDDLRKLETVIYAFSDIPDNDGDEPKGLENQYLVEVSTHGKHITVKTCKRNDEEYSYTVQLNTKDSCYMVKDDVGNVIYLDSKNTEIRSENEDKSYISLNKKNINLFAYENINLMAEDSIHLTALKDIVLKADNEIHTKSIEDTSIESENKINIEAKSDFNMVTGNIADLKSKSDFNITSGGDVNISPSSNFVVSAGSNINIQGVTASLKGDTNVSVVAPTIRLSGSVNISLGLRGDKYSAGLTIDGNLDLRGSGEISNSLTVNDLTAEAINANTIKATRMEGNFYGTLYGSVVP